MKNQILFCIVIVLVTIINEKCVAINVCGLEGLEFCDPTNKTCLIEFTEPKARKWFIKGRPDYFLEPIDPYVIDILPLKVNDKLYKIEGATFTGFDNLKLTDWDVNLEKLLLIYDYDYNLDVSIEKFVDEKGASLIDNKPLLLHLVNTHTTTRVSIKFIKRCDGSTYFSFFNPSVTVRDIKEGEVVLEHELQSEHKEEIIKELGKTLSISANRIISKNWRQFASSTPITNYWKIQLP